MAQILCPFCTSIAEPVSWAKEVELYECEECQRVWEAEHHIKLWEKYQIKGGERTGKKKT